MPSHVSIADDQNQNVVTVGLTGSLYANGDPWIAFVDTFDGASLDSTNRWTLAGTVPPTASGLGSALVNPSTTANASSSLVSQPTFQQGGTFILACLVQVEAGVMATGNHRFLMGIGTQPGSWTAATPLQDAIGFEIDTSGVLRASVYNSGVRLDTKALTAIQDGFPHLFVLVTRPNLTYFCIDNFAIPLYTSNFSPANQILPIRAHSINAGATTTGTPTLSLAALALTDQTRPAQAQGDGVYPWRRQTIYPQAGSFSAQVNTEGQRATYRYTVSGFTPVATPTAFVVIQGSATKVVRIKRIYVSGVATAAGNMPLLGTRRSTAGTLGSAVLTPVTAMKHDPNDGAATAVVSTVGTANYTTLGTAAGQGLSSRIGLAAVGTGVADSPALYDFATRNDKPIILRGTSDFFTLEGAGAAVPAGGALDIEIETEEDTF